VLSPQRDKQLIGTLAAQMRACALTTTVLVCGDGLSSYVEAITRAFSERVPTGKRGRPPRVCSPGFLLAQVVKTSAKQRVVAVSRRVVRGGAEAVAQVLTTASGGTHQINTAYIERLNATFRAAGARERGEARIVSVSSTAHMRSPIVFDDLHFERRTYDPQAAYAQSKTANVLFAVEATRRWAC